MSIEELIDIEEAEKIERSSAPQRTIVRATPFAWRQPHTIAPRQWLYGGHYIRRYITATVSPGGLGKSSNALVEALAMVTGEPLVGFRVRRPLRVWYWNGEDPAEEIARRVAALCKYFQICESDIGDRLYTDGGRDTKILIADRYRDTVTVNRALVDALTQEIVEKGIDCLIVDPFLSTHCVPENDNGAIEQVARAYAAIAENANCALELVHHTRKVSAGGTNMERTIDDARGAGALAAAARSVRVLNVMSKDEAGNANIQPEHRTL
jgi:RecA-family ATPase